MVTPDTTDGFIQDLRRCIIGSVPRSLGFSWSSMRWTDGSHKKEGAPHGKSRCRIAPLPDPFGDGTR
jgi:hypothetical protein